MKRDSSNLARARAQAAQERERRIAAVCKRLEDTAAKKEAETAQPRAKKPAVSSSILKGAKRKRSPQLRPHGKDNNRQQENEQEEEEGNEEVLFVAKRKRGVDLTAENSTTKTPPTRIKLDFDTALLSGSQEKQQRVHVVQNEMEKEQTIRSRFEGSSAKEPQGPIPPRYLSYTTNDNNNNNNASRNNRVADRSIPTTSSSSRCDSVDNRQSAFERDAHLLFSRSMDSSFTGVLPKSDSNTMLQSMNEAIPTDSSRATLRRRRISPTESPSSMLSLEKITDLSRLETVEGIDILHTMLTTRSRHPPINQRHDSKQQSAVKEHEVLLWQQLRKQRMNQKRKQDTVKARVNSESKSESAENQEPSVERCVSRFRRADGLRWWNSLVWCGQVLLLLGVCVVVYLTLLALWKPTMLPFCDSKRVDMELVHSHAIQLYTGAQCRSCPMFGICVEGRVVDCLEPFELQEELCVESSEAQQAIYKLARALENFIVRQVSNQVATLSMWTLHSTFRPMVSLSDVREHAHAIARNTDSIASLPSSHVVNRALELALGELKDVSVVSEELLSVGMRVLPWVDRTKLFLMAHCFWLSALVTLFGAGGVLYFHVTAYRAQHGLVDRLFKEVRFFLLTRLQQAEHDESCVAYFPVDHLRDLLLESLVVLPKERRLVRDRVWPRVVSLVADDARILVRHAKIDGQRMDVWQWSSAGSRRRVSRPRRR